MVEETGRGQVGYWFLLRFSGTDDAIDLQDASEFSSWQWIPFERLVTAVVEFRKHVYRRLNERFDVHLAGDTLPSTPDT
jgi:putative (di)nucleoside polyphosphate hydrolase